MSAAPDHLLSEEYARQRMAPRPGDFYYLSLADLLLGIRLALPHLGDGKVLDFGCGGSPYRQLFKSWVYERADLEGDPSLDHVIRPDSTIGAANGSYDVILSTQVLEHVADIGAYLGECHRLLRPGGRLLVTTHGLFPEHACPGDYRRWTPEGLAIELGRAGLYPILSHKLTTGPRALFLLMRISQQALLCGGWSPGAILVRLIRAPYRFWPAALDRLCDRLFAGSAVAGHGPGTPELYVGILVVAEKPVG